jgi:hypothetical protein
VPVAGCLCGHKPNEVTGEATRWPGLLVSHASLAACRFPCADAD